MAIIYDGEGPIKTSWKDIKAFLKEFINPQIKVEELECIPEFQREIPTIEKILSTKPPGDFFRRTIARANLFRNPNEKIQSKTHIYEAGLRKYKNELLSRPDLPKKTRKYIEKYVLR